ncbi:MAG: hypothetical protein ABW061_09105 [Polyangiaceae bacterium]
MRSFPISSRLTSGLLLSLSLLGCDTSTLPDGYVAFVNAPGEDPWAADPAVDHVQIDFVAGSTRTLLADESAQPDTVSIGSQAMSANDAHFEATGFDSAGDAVVFGATVPFDVQSFAGVYIPVFAGRKGGFTTAPDTLVSPHIHPLSAVSAQRYLLLAGGADAAFDAYNAAAWGSATNSSDPLALPQTVKSMAISGTVLLMINDEKANYIDLAGSGTTAATAPTGLKFADIVGGQTLVASDSTIYIVGATRTEGAATNKVLEIDPTGTLLMLQLKTPRLGAAATLVEDSLLVVGGSAKGAGAELLRLRDTTFSALDLPADETSGASVVELTSASALLAGGHDASGAPSATRTIDLSCSSECSTAELPKLKLSIGRASAFRLAENVALIVGESDDTETHAYLFDASGDEPTLVEKILRTPRSQAAAVTMPNGQIAVVGGTELSTGNPALTLDVFFP